MQTSRKKKFLVCILLKKIFNNFFHAYFSSQNVHQQSQQGGFNILIQMRVLCVSWDVLERSLKQLLWNFRRVQPAEKSEKWGCCYQRTSPKDLHSPTLLLWDSLRPGILLNNISVMNKLSKLCKSFTRLLNPETDGNKVCILSAVLNVSIHC